MVSTVSSSKTEEKFCIVRRAEDQRLNFTAFDQYVKNCWECPGNNDGMCHLASARSKEEYDVILSLLGDEFAFVGGIESNYVWGWTDGSSWNYEDLDLWAWRDNVGYGGCGSPADCTRLYGATNPNAGFEDDCCSNEYLLGVVRIPQSVQPTDSCQFEASECVSISTGETAPPSKTVATLESSNTVSDILIVSTASPSINENTSMSPKPTKVSTSQPTSALPKDVTEEWLEIEVIFKNAGMLLEQEISRFEIATANWVDTFHLSRRLSKKMLFSEVLFISQNVVRDDNTVIYQHSVTYQTDDASFDIERYVTDPFRDEMSLAEYEKELKSSFDNFAQLSNINIPQVLDESSCDFSGNECEALFRIGGTLMSRSLFFLPCKERCVPQFLVQLSNRLGWACGSCSA